MSVEIDSALEAAVIEIVQEMGQPEATSNRIIAWLKSMSSSDQTVDEQEQSLQRVLSSLIVKDQTSEN